MTETPEERLGRFVRDRRKKLRLEQTDFKKRGGPSHTTIGKIERAEGGGLHPGTKAALEFTLEWIAGSVDAILAGGDPIERPDFDDARHPERSLAPAEDPWPPELSRDDERAVAGARAAYTELHAQAQRELEGTERDMEWARLMNQSARDRLDRISRTLSALQGRLNELRTKRSDLDLAARAGTIQRPEVGGQADAAEQDQSEADGL